MIEENIKLYLKLWLDNLRCEMLTSFSIENLKVSGERFKFLKLTVKYELE